MIVSSYQAARGIGATSDKGSTLIEFSDCFIICDGMVKLGSMFVGFLKRRLFWIELPWMVSTFSLRILFSGPRTVFAWDFLGRSILPNGPLCQSFHSYHGLRGGPTPWEIAGSAIGVSQPSTKSTAHHTYVDNLGVLNVSAGRVEKAAAETKREFGKYGFLLHEGEVYPMGGGALGVVVDGNHSQMRISLNKNVCYLDSTANCCGP